MYVFVAYFKTKRYVFYSLMVSFIINIIIITLWEFFISVLADGLSLES